MRGGRFKDILSILIAAIVLLVALHHGYRVTAGLDWPHDVDLYRDISQAQSFVDGRWQSDPFYANERLWYNPLVPAMVAGIAKVSGQPVHRLYVRLGAWLNLLGPLFFWLLAWRLFDRWTALAALIGFLFISSGNLPSWTAATYSPWLFAANFTQSLFYLSLIVFFQALRSGQLVWHLLTGCLLGLTFMGHTAPALILGTILVVVPFIEFFFESKKVFYPPPSRESGKVRLLSPFLGLAVSLIAALLVSLPFSASILGHYRLKVLNRAPSDWVYPLLSLDQIGDKPAQFFTPWSYLALLGLIALGIGAIPRLSKRLVFLWGSVSAFALGYGFLWQLLRQKGIVWPAILPHYHFLLYLKAAEALFGGIGLVWGVRWTVGLVRRWRPQLRQGWLHGLVVGMLLMHLGPSAVRRYPRRSEFVDSRTAALQRERESDRIGLWRWSRAHIGPDEVVLTDDPLMGILILGPAGRRSLTVDPCFSNPYADFNARAKVQTELMKAIVSEDFEKLLSLSRLWSVRFIVSDWPELQRKLEMFSSHGLVLETIVGDYRVYGMTEAMNPSAFSYSTAPAPL